MRQRTFTYWVEVGRRLETGDINKSELSVYDIAEARAALKAMREMQAKGYRHVGGSMPTVVMTGNIKTAHGKVKGVTFTKWIERAKKIKGMEEIISRACGVDIRGELNN